MKKKKENKRKKMRTLILLLFLTITMFGASTYAWFTANRMVTINSLDVHVEASNGLQISTDAVAWKSVITNTDILQNAYANNVNMVPSSVTAVSTDGTVNADTRGIDMYKSIIGNDSATGDYNIKAELDTEAAGTTGNFIAFDVFLRVDEDKDIYMTNASNVVAKGDDKGLKNASRIAFVPVGHGASTLSSAELIALKYSTADMPSKAIIWEPNATTHTDLVVASVAPEYKVSLNNASGGTRTKYYGLKTAIADPMLLIPVVNPDSITDSAQAAPYRAVSSEVTPDIVTAAGNTNYVKAFNLKAGVTKMRIYMWLEGQDIDCENGATGSDVTYNLQFSTDSSAPVTP